MYTYWLQTYLFALGIFEEGASSRGCVDLPVQHEDEIRSIESLFYNVVWPHQCRPRMMWLARHFFVDVFCITDLPIEMYDRFSPYNSIIMKEAPSC